MGPKIPFLISCLFCHPVQLSFCLNLNLPFLTRHTILVELVAESSDANAKHFGSVGPVALAVLEREHDVLLFQGGQRQDFRRR